MKGEWQRVKMSDLIDEISMGPFGSDIKVSCFVDSGVPALNGSNLTGFRMNDDSLRFVSEEKADSLGKANARRGDVLVTHRGTLGQIVYVPKTSKYDRYVISQSQFRFRCKDCLLPQFIVYYFHSRIGQHKLLANASQVGVPALARATSTFKEIEITLPPLPTQRRIAAVLGALDDKIELNRKMNANLEAQAQALFKSWFVDFAPWGGQMPTGWKKGTLGEIAEIVMGNSPKGDTLNTEGEGEIFYQGKTEFGWRFPGVRLFTTAPKRIANAGDVLVSVRAPVGALNIANNRCCIGRGVAAVSSKWRSFVYYALQYAKPQFDVYNGEGTVFGCIDKDGMHGIKVMIPSCDCLDEFEAIVGKLDSMIANNDRESRKLAELRDALLPKLMSGELEVA